MTLQDYKIKYARLYNLSESQIDESLIPIFISLEAQQNSIFERLNASDKANMALSERIKGTISTQNHNYPPNLRPLTALMLRWGWGMWFVGGLIALVVFYWGQELSKPRSETEIAKELNRYKEQIQDFKANNPKSGQKYFPEK